MTDATVVALNQKKPWPTIPGPKILLFGPPGGGKSHALRTLLEVDPEIEVFAIITEPMGMEVLSDTPKDRFHWVYIPPQATNFDNLLKAATVINQMTYEDLSKLKGGNKLSYGQYIKFLSTLASYTCDRCGKHIGPVDGLTNKQPLVFDSLSGLNIMILDNTTGGKPTRHEGEWGVAIEQEEKLLNTTCGLNAPFILTAHVDREINPVDGTTAQMPGALGRKLPARLSRFFSDCIYASQEQGKFTWSTTKLGVETKARNLPWAGDLPQTFVPLFERWRERALKGE